MHVPEAHSLEQGFGASPLTVLVPDLVRGHIAEPPVGEFDLRERDDVDHISSRFRLV